MAILPPPVGYLRVNGYTLLPRLVFWSSRAAGADAMPSPDQSVWARLGRNFDRFQEARREHCLERGGDLCPSNVVAKTATARRDGARI